MKTKGQAESNSDFGTAEKAKGTTHPGRRQILTTAGTGLLAAAALAGTASAAQAAPTSTSPVPGGWLITRHDASTPVPIRSILTFSTGGAAAGLDLEPTAPPYLGSWEARDANRFAFTFWTPITDDQGASVGTARVKAIAHLDGNRLSGSYTALIFLQGQRGHGSGTFQGTRIDPN
jgi:hypothetical protein